MLIKMCCFPVDRKVMGFVFPYGVEILPASSFSTQFVCFYYMLVSLAQFHKQTSRNSSVSTVK